jgi:hypothetical protein
VKNCGPYHPSSSFPGSCAPRNTGSPRRAFAAQPTQLRVVAPCCLLTVTLPKTLKNTPKITALEIFREIAEFFLRTRDQCVVVGVWPRVWGCGLGGQILNKAHAIHKISHLLFIDFLSFLQRLGGDGRREAGESLLQQPVIPERQSPRRRPGVVAAVIQEAYKKLSQLLLI